VEYVIGGLIGFVVAILVLLTMANWTRPRRPDPQWTEQLAHNARVEARLVEQVAVLRWIGQILMEHP
jgi:hypothetical protein